MTIESCLKKSKNTVQDDDNNSPEQGKHFYTQ